MRHAIAICLIVPLMIIACDGQRDRRVKDHPPRRIRSVMSWERSLVDGLSVGVDAGCFSSREEYDSGQVVMPVRMTTYDTAGRTMSEFELSFYPNSDLGDDFGPQIYCNLLSLPSCSVRQAFYFYTPDKERVSEIRCFEGTVNLGANFIADLFSLFSDSGITEREYYFYNHRGDTDRIEAVWTETGNRTVRARFLYNTAGRLESTIIPLPMLLGSDRYYDTVHYHYDDWIDDNRVTRLDSCWYSVLFVYGKNGEMSKRIILDPFKNYGGETKIEWYQGIGRVERRFGSTGELLDQTLFDVYGLPLLSWIWNRRADYGASGFAPVIWSGVDDSDTRPLLIKEYHYEWW